MEKHQAPESLEDYRVNDRVEMHPGTDIWMMGDRYGVVTKIGRRFLHLKMERSGRNIRTLPSCLQNLWERG